MGGLFDPSSHTLTAAMVRSDTHSARLVPPSPVRRLAKSVFASVVVAMLALGCGHDNRPAPTSAPPGDPALLHTSNAGLRGVVAPDPRLYAGIPYAQPPLGPLRFRAPVPAQPWQ